MLSLTLSRRSVTILHSVNLYNWVARREVLLSNLLLIESNILSTETA